MPTIIDLLPGERLTDRLLTEQATRVRDQVNALRQAHEQDVSTFLAGVGERAGQKFPPTARRETGPDGVIRLTWDDPTPAPAPAPIDPHAPALP